MIDDQALLSTIIADPDDDRPRLVYADWLQEHGQLDRARLIRVQIELARLPDNENEPTALQIEEGQLVAACEKALPRLKGITWGGFERGLVSSVYAATPASFRRHANCIADVGSVHRVVLKNPDGFDVLAQVSALARFTDLRVFVWDDDHVEFRNGDPNHRFNDDLQAVLTSPHCPRLRRLELVTCQLGPRGAKALADCPRLESLIHLDLVDNYVGDEGMAALAASPYLSALRTLRIDLNDIGPAGVEALAASVSLGGLEDLFIGDKIGPALGLALSRSPYLTHLRELSLHDYIGELGAAALAQAPNLAGLTYLDIRCVIYPDGARALAASPYLRQLKSLLLHGGDIGDEGAKALARSPVLATLEYLGLSLNNLTDEGARALAASPYLERLKQGGLEIRSLNRLTADGMQALLARFGDAVGESRDETLDQPPFPPLKWEACDWVAEVRLPSWAGFQTQCGGCGSGSSDGPSNGTAQLRVTPEDDNSRTPPTAEQVAAFRHLMDNEAAVAAAVGHALVEYYPGEKDAYLNAYDDGEVEELPDISEPGELRSLIGLSSVHVLSVVKDGAAYIGFEFGCVWDNDHGAGVMTHLGRVVATGQADVSFLEWIAKQDIEPR